MTELCFLTSDELEGEARVLSCRPSETGAGAFELVLDRTLFHPKGGGQPADAGTIAGVPVTGVFFGPGGEAVHTTAAPVEPGRVHLSVDAAVRMRHARWHSAAHLMAEIVQREGVWKAVRGNHRPGEGFVVFHPAGESREKPDPKRIESAMARVVEAALPRRQTMDAQGRRFVGWEGFPMEACGGTHVASSAEIGHFRVRKVKLSKDELRVSYEVD